MNKTIFSVQFNSPWRLACLRLLLTLFDSCPLFSFAGLWRHVVFDFCVYCFFLNFFFPKFVLIFCCYYFLFFCYSMLFAYCTYDGVVDRPMTRRIFSICLVEGCHINFIYHLNEKVWEWKRQIEREDVCMMYVWERASLWSRLWLSHFIIIICVLIISFELSAKSVYTFYCRNDGIIFDYEWAEKNGNFWARWCARERKCARNSPTDINFNKHRLRYAVEFCCCCWSFLFLILL